MVPSVETSMEAQIAALMTLEKLTYDLNSKFYKFYSGLDSGSMQSEFSFLSPILSMFCSIFKWVG